MNSSLPSLLPSQRQLVHHDQGPNNSRGKGPPRPHTAWINLVDHAFCLTMGSDIAVTSSSRLVSYSSGEYDLPVCIVHT
jgi:hypothetical protein